MTAPETVILGVLSEIDWATGLLRLCLRHSRTGDQLLRISLPGFEYKIIVYESITGPNLFAALVG